MAARTAQDRLARERAELEGTLAALRHELHRLVDEGAEAAEADFSEEGGDPDVGVVERDRVRARIGEVEERLRQLGRAEAAVEAGTYGTCRECGARIPDERLEALPTTSLCVACKAAGHTP